MHFWSELEGNSPQAGQQPGLHLREGAINLVLSRGVVLGLAQHAVPALQVPSSRLRAS